MTSTDSFPCLMVRRADDGKVQYALESISVDQLPPGEVLIEVEFSSLNYKDALACRAHPGVVNQLPHVPGIDCAGRVVESSSSDFAPGDSVLVTGYELGAPRWGGFSKYVRVPADWVVSLPAELSAVDAMTYGTAGFTAAQCVTAIQRQGVAPEAGDVVVTGATGGVGSLAIAILSRLGYRVVAVTGKAEQESLLRRLGAQQILGREEVDDSSDAPLLKARFAAAVDTVGGSILATLVRSTNHRGCVAACGLTAGDKLPLTVYPFILRGVTLSGIDSAKCPRAPRLEIWRRLATDWKLDCLADVRRETDLSQLPTEIEAMLSGKSLGRLVVRVAE